MTNRSLLWFVLFFLLGIIGTKWGCMWILIPILAFYLWERIRAFRENKKWVFLLAPLLLALLFFTAGHMRYDNQRQAFQEFDEYLAKESGTLKIKGTIIKKEEKNEQIIYELNHVQIEGHKNYFPYHALFYVEADVHTESYSIGTTIFASGSIRPFVGATNDGNFDAKEYYNSKKIAFAMRNAKLLSIQARTNVLIENLYHFKKKITEVYLKSLNQEEAGVIALMALGEKEFLDDDIKKLYQQSGISHVLAISGLHISLIGSGVVRLLQLLRFGKRSSALFGLVFVCCFGLMSGLGIATFRAVCMFFVMSGGKCLGRGYDTLTALAVAMLIQLWDNPFLIANVGFLLSYTAVLGVVYGNGILKKFYQGDKQQKWKQKQKRKKQEKERELQKQKQRNTIRAVSLLPYLQLAMQKVFQLAKETFFISLSIQIATLPILLYFFYEFPPYSLLINSILLPLIGLLLGFGILGGLTGLIHPVLGQILLWPCERILNWNEAICSLFTKLPGSMWITGKPPGWVMIGYYGVVLGVLVFMWRVNEKTEEEKEQCSNLLKIPVTSILCFSFFALILIRPAPVFSIDFLDVGQGDGSCIETQEGKHFFIDGGSSSVTEVGKYRILPYLKSHGIAAIDGWFISHGDSDHYSGLLELWDLGYSVKSLILSEHMIHDSTRQELEDMAKVHGTKLYYMHPGQSLSTKSLSFLCLAPKEEGRDTNGNSMVLLLTEGKDFRAFFGGDLTEEEERKLAREEQLPKLTLFKANHHGSKTSNSTELLKSLSPALTIISCAERNSYGHPSKEAVTRIEESGSQIFYTMKSGQISIRERGGHMWVKEKVVSLYNVTVQRENAEQ
ncbi:DNA internalization-related competence protein ComEC/Rec2 [Clostridia bacterium]|nr:DNA internalization-related competence protein ComEC/Rec2 [Clostridia bacterium]